MVYEREVAELLLVKEGGYSMADINGRDGVHLRERPANAVETLRESMPERARPLAGLVALGTGVAASVSPPVALGVLVLLTALVSYRALDADAEPRVEREKVSYPGMSEAEVWRRAAALDELVDLRNQEAESETKRAEREAGGLPGSTG